MLKINICHRPTAGEICKFVLKWVLSFFRVKQKLFFCVCVCASVQHKNSAVLFFLYFSLVIAQQRWHTVNQCERELCAFLLTNDCIPQSAYWPAVLTSLQIWRWFVRNSQHHLCGSIPCCQAWPCKPLIAGGEEMWRFNQEDNLVCNTHHQHNDN